LKFRYGSKDEPTTAPAGLIQQSVENEIPIIHVSINYRLGFFGFAQSDTLKREGSGNAGLRDQRLAIEWVRDNIASFGGDPEKITIFGQSSGGLAVGMQILAYGGSRPLPFQQGIAESQALEPGITANFTIDAMSAVADYVGCNSTSVHSSETIACLRAKDTDTLLEAAITTYASDIAHNIGDVWLPAVDGDFLPYAPSKLIADGRIGNATFIAGWTQDDLNFYTNTSIATAGDTYDFIRAYLPGLNQSSLNDLLGMYPISEFAPATNLSAEFFRSARIFRDVLMVCPSLHLGAAVAKTLSKPVYHYNFNQTVVDQILDPLNSVSGLGAGHTSEFAYVFDSFRAYDKAGFPVQESRKDHELMERASRSWSTFFATGSPEVKLHATLHNWSGAYASNNGPFIMTIGGPHEGMSPAGGPVGQRLSERCRFLNDAAIIEALGY
jgi:carboxylesterase type B